MDDDKYPYWKDALFGNHNAVANIRCALHYVFWHAIYSLIAVAGVIVVGAIKLGKAVAPYLGPAGRPLVAALKRFGNGVHRVLNHPYTKKLAAGVYLAFGIGLIITIVGVIAYHLYVAFWVTLAGFGLGIGYLVALLALVALASYLHDPAANAKNKLAAGASSAGHKAVQTPGIRRVYGECPVSMDAAPKWFNNTFPDR